MNLFLTENRTDCFGILHLCKTQTQHPEASNFIEKETSTQLFSCELEQRGWNWLKYSKKLRAFWNWEAQKHIDLCFF